jgi:hypothetical protein
MPRIAQKLEFVAVEAIAAVGGQMNKRDNSRYAQQNRPFGPALAGDRL